MAEFAAHTYYVGGAWTHGGEPETHHDDMPRDLVTCWDIAEDNQYQRLDDEHGQRWYPVDHNGEPVTGDGGFGWTELLDEVGPVWDGLQEPAREPDWAWV